ncbi:MAG: hypothetical protein ACREMA_03630 [Longimicrobiales bacterium]
MLISTPVRITLALTGVAGLLLLIASRQFQMPVLIGPGLLLFAAGTITAGAEAMTRRFIVERNRVAPSSAIFHGSAAILLGLALVVLGAALAVAGVAFLMGAEQRLAALLLERPGFVLAPAGAVLGATGSARVIGAQSWRGSAWRFLSNLPERFGGILVVIFGLGLLAAGLFDILAPDAFDDTVRSLIAPFSAR